MRLSRLGGNRRIGAENEIDRRMSKGKPVIAIGLLGSVSHRRTPEPP